MAVVSDYVTAVPHNRVEQKPVLAWCPQEGSGE